jgi:hypothetical protein
MTEILQTLSVRMRMERISRLFRYFFIGIEITLFILFLFAPDVTFLGVSAASWSRIVVTLILVGYIIETMLSVRAGSTPWHRLLLPCFSLVGLLFTSLYSTNLVVLVLFSILPEVLLFAILGIVVLGFRKKGANFEQKSLEDTFSLFVPISSVHLVVRLLLLENMVISAAFSTALKGFKISDVPGYRYDETSIFPYLIAILMVSTPADILLIEIMIKSWPLPVHLLHIGLSLSIIPWIYGIYVTTRINPHQINSDIVHLKQGVFGRADFPLEFVVSAKVLPAKVAEQLTSNKKGHDTSYAQLLFPQMKPQTQVVEILLSQEITVHKILGDLTSRKLLVSIDEPAPFLAALRQDTAIRE